MSATRLTEAERTGQYLISQLKGRSDVVGVWVRQCRNTAEIWVLVETEDIEDERSVRRLLWKLLDRFPDSEVDLQVTNVHGTEEHMRGYLVPHDAKRLAL